jgi:hypothetical protein
MVRNESSLITTNTCGSNPLNVVLAALGFETFNYRKSGTEGYGACPIHQAEKNTTSVSFDESGKFYCFRW